MLLLAIFALGLVGCSGREIGEDARAILEGKVEPLELDHDQRAGIAGLAIRVFQIGPGGKLHEVGARTARTDEQGGYQAEIYAAREPGPWPLLVDSYRGETLASRVLVAAAVHANERLAVAPAGRETFLEAQILLRALATGQWPHDGSVAWLRAMGGAAPGSGIPPMGTPKSTHAQKVCSSSQAPSRLVWTRGLADLVRAESDRDF